MKHNLLKSVIISVILLMGVSNALGATTATLYYSVPASTVGCYTVKCYYDFGYSQTGLVEMTKVDKTSSGNLIYSVELTANNNNVDNLLFQLFDGSTWKSEQQVMKDWTPLANNSGKMYVHNTGWKAYSTDAAYTVYFVNKDSWIGTIKAYAWHNDCDKNADWSGADMTPTGKTYKGKNIYSIAFNKRYANIIFNNGSSQTDDLALGSTYAGKMYYDENWIAYNYDVKVTFNDNGHGTAPSAKTVLKGEKVSAPTAPTATGYTFGGWHTDAACTNAFDFNTAITANITLYAKWTAIRCNITLGKKGKDEKGGSEYVYATYGSNILEPEIENPTKEGYNFLGWSNQAGNVIVIDTNGKLLPSKSNGSLITYTDANGNWAHTETSSVLWAQWEAAKYNINYKDQGNANFSGTHASGYPTQHTYGKATSLSTASKTGYTFEGWYKEAACTNKVTSLGATAYTANITLYAKWTANKYTVTLSNQGATTAGTASVQATYGSAMPSATMPTKTGYTFGGYNTSNNGGGTQYYTANGASARTWNIAENSTLYAKWTPINYTITYNTNGGNSIANKTYTIETATFDLPTPTQTGYTFAGWYDNVDLTGNKVTQITKGSIGNKTFYAKWTIKQYTLYFSADGGTVTGTAGGNPITSPATINHGTSVSLTATPSGENAFAQWVDKNGSPLSSNNPYTFNIKDDITAKAVFSQPTTVYFKPSDNWKEANAHFAIYAWGKFESWVELEKIDCHDNYYKADVPAGFSDFAFVRLIPSSDPAYNSNNNGYNWENKWNQTENLIVPTDGKKMYDVADRTHIHLRPNSNWTQDNARFAAYFFNNSGGQWVSLTKNGNEYTCVKPTGYTSVIFGRMQPGSTNSFDADKCWNKTKDLTILNDGTNCFTIKNDDWGCAGNGDSNNGADGEWSTVLNNSQWKVYDAPTYTVKLEKTTYGKYAIVLNGQTYYSSQSEDVVISDVPVESTLQVVSAESFHTAYNNNMCIQTHDGADFENIELNTAHKICGTTIVKENFSTAAAHTVYLKVSTATGDVNTNWNQNGCSNFIYSFNNTSGEVITTTNLPDGEIYKASGYNYYKFVIPAGCRTFRFERKTDPNVYYASNTENFLRYLPLGTSNCYTIEKKISDNSDGTKTFNGSWGMSLANGDYRLLYVEQVVEKSNASGNEWKTVVTRKKAHPSDIIKKGVESQIVSLHIYKERKYTANAGGGKTYESTSNPEIILQQFSNGTWTNIERHMVLGPLETLPGMAMAPGKRNAAADAELVYDDGIEIIKQDTEAGRVWNFTVKQKEGVVTLPLDEANLKPYEGNYYIRTDNSEGGWMDYTIPANYMTYSQYAKDNSNFSHYFCRWVEKNITPNTKFVIANDHGVAISDTLSGDQFTDIHGNIQEDANIRWSWNETTNEIARAYIQGAYDGQNQNANIVLDYTTDGETDATDVILFDTGDWIYSIDVNNVKVGSTLKSITATYPKIKHTIDGKVINPTTQIFEQELPMLTGGNSENTYTVRVLYDFKIDKTLVALVPNEKEANIGIDVLMERIDQEPMTTQVKAGITSQKDEGGSTVYGVMTFTKSHLIAPEKSEQQKLTYWISFPFDVRLSDIFGFGAVGKYWMIKFYDGASRAKNGLYDDNTYWKFITNSKYVLKANQGYVLSLDKKVMDQNSTIYTNRNQISLYFPSKDKIDEINKDFTTTTPCTIPEHICEITSPTDRRIYDSNWNLIGVPSYGNHNKTTNNTNVKYFYDYDHASDSYTVAENAGTKPFQAMFAYMVQFAGTIDWSTFTFTENAQGLAAKKANAAYNQHNLRLELQQSGSKLDHTFIQLQDEEATEMFDMNSDLCKIINAGSNIYSIITTESTPIQVAGNVMPIQETIIPIGIVTSAAGEYTFAMPDGTDGIVVELIDYENNTRTNMLFDNYTVNLDKGTFENRFALHVKPSKVTTSVEDVTTNTMGVKKYLIDGVLYMQKDGVLYDAQGKLVR